MCFAFLHSLPGGQTLSSHTLVYSTENLEHMSRSAKPGSKLQFHPILSAMSNMLSFLFLNILSLFYPTNHTKQGKKLEDLA